MEYGIVIAQGITHVRKLLPTILEDETNEVSSRGRKLFNELLCQLYNLDTQVDTYDKELEQLCRSNELYQRLIELNGVGAISATAIVATVGMLMSLRMVERCRLFSG